MLSRAQIVGGVAAIAVIATIGWVVLRQGEAERDATSEVAGGPLRLPMGQQGFAVEAPEHTPYRVTFGAIPMCSTEEPARITGVTTTERVRPDSISYWIRESTDAPVVAALGSPPEFAEPYSNGRPSGRYRPLGSGFEVDVRCGPASEPIPFGNELMVEMTVSARGASIAPLTVHYVAGDRRFFRIVDFDMTACGSATEIKEDCSSPPTGG